MAIFQRAYQGYHGEISTPGHRPWVIFRYAIADVFSSRLFSIFFTLCFIPPLVLMCFIYMRYNIEMLVQFDINPGELLTINADFFAYWMQRPQMIVSFILVMVVGPGLISPDLRNNALPLYLSRPVSKAYYILGKLLVLMVLGSMVTWVPALFLISFQAYLAGDGWLMDNLRFPVAAISSAMVWLLCLSMISLAVSASIKSKVLARLFFFGLIFMGSAVSGTTRHLFGGWLGSVISLPDTAQVMIASMYGTFTWHEMPGEVAALVFVITTLLATVFLTRRIRAFEVVS